MKKKFSQNNIGMQFDREMRRRSLWTTWCSFFTSGNQLDPSRVYDRVTNLPLPARFGKGESIQGVDLMQGEKMDRNWKSNASNATRRGLPVSLIADLAKLMRIWYFVSCHYLPGQYSLSYISVIG
jgi:hypothetical protein